MVTDEDGATATTASIDVLQLTIHQYRVIWHGTLMKVISITLTQEQLLSQASDVDEKR